MHKYDVSYIHYSTFNCSAKKAWREDLYTISSIHWPSSLRALLFCWCCRFVVVVVVVVNLIPYSVPSPQYGCALHCTESTEHIAYFSYNRISISYYTTACRDVCKLTDNAIASASALSCFNSHRTDHRTERKTCKSPINWAVQNTKQQQRNGTKVCTRWAIVLICIDGDAYRMHVCVFVSDTCVLCVCWGTFFTTLAAASSAFFKTKQKKKTE